MKGRLSRAQSESRARAYFYQGQSFRMFLKLILGFPHPAVNKWRGKAHMHVPTSDAQLKPNIRPHIHLGQINTSFHVNESSWCFREGQGLSPSTGESWSSSEGCTSKHAVIRVKSSHPAMYLSGEITLKGFLRPKHQWGTTARACLCQRQFYQSWNYITREKAPMQKPEPESLQNTKAQVCLHQNQNSYKFLNNWYNSMVQTPGRQSLILHRPKVWAPRKRAGLSTGPLRRAQLEFRVLFTL